MTIQTRKNVRFTFMCNKQERNLIDQISIILDRSLSDTVRWLIVKAAKELGVPNSSSQTTEVMNEKFTEIPE